MTTEQKKIAIAEVCGWVRADETEIKERAGNAAWLLSKGPWWRNKQENTIANCENLPDYLNDLNAMHEAVKSLTQDQMIQYSKHIGKLVTSHLPASRAAWIDFGIINATSAQRAEAFLRTLGLSEDQP